VWPGPVTTTVTITTTPPNKPAGGGSVVLTSVMTFTNNNGQPITKCPSDAEMAAIAKAYMDAIRARPGVVSVTLISISCTWIVSPAPRPRRAAPPGPRPRPLGRLPAQPSRGPPAPHATTTPPPPTRPSPPGQ
jgi:hypothetical protein